MEFHLEHPFSHSSLHKDDSHDDALPLSLFLVEFQHMPSSHYFLSLKSSASLLSNRNLAISSITQVFIELAQNSISVKLFWVLVRTLNHYRKNLPFLFLFLFCFTKLQYSRKFGDPSLTYVAVNYLDRFLSSEDMPVKTESSDIIFPFVSSEIWLILFPTAAAIQALDSQAYISILSLIVCQNEKARDLCPWSSGITKTLNLFTMRMCLYVLNKWHEHWIFQVEGEIFDAQTIERMENVILGALKWRMRSVTPLSFLSFFLSLFELKEEDPSLLKHSLKSQATDLTFNLQPGNVQ